MATKKDYQLVLIIGLAVGLLVQPILSNTLFKAEACIGVEGVPNDCGGNLLIRLVVFLAFALLAPTALFIASWIGRKIPVIYQFAKFAAVGSLNSFIDLGVFNTLSYFLTTGGKVENLPFFAFKSVSFLAATTNSYLWNKNWTFKSNEETHTSTVVKFYAITAMTYLLSTGVATGVNAIGPLFGIPGNVWSNVLAPICGIFTALLVNFLSYKFIVFKKVDASIPSASAVV